MGYTTDFDGRFKLNKPLEKKHADYLKAFAETRRMKRNPDKVLLRPDKLRDAVKLPVGVDGGFYVGGKGDSFGQDKTDDIIDYNKPPDGQPGLWTQWVPSEDGEHIEWDGGDKFYEYVEWLRYIIANFLEPWGYKLDGEVKWFGESRDDMGIIICENNKVTTKEAEITYK